MNTATATLRYETTVCNRLIAESSLAIATGRTPTLVTRNASGNRLTAALEYPSVVVDGLLQIPVLSMHKSQHKAFYAIVAKLRDVLAQLVNPVATVAPVTTVPAYNDAISRYDADWPATPYGDPIDDVLNCSPETLQIINKIYGTEPTAPAAVATTEKCERCNGRGTVHCFECNTDGKYLDSWGDEKTCTKCDGTKRRDCNDCKGTGEVELPPTTPAARAGVADGMKAIARKAKQAECASHFCPMCHKTHFGNVIDDVWSCPCCPFRVNLVTGETVKPFECKPEKSEYIRITAEYVAAVMARSNTAAAVSSARGSI